MSKINPSHFTSEERSLKQIATEILTVPLDEKPKKKSTPRTTFATCLQDSIEADMDADGSAQLQRYGPMDFIGRAEELSGLLQEIADGKVAFTRDETETLKDSLTIVAGELKARTQNYMEELEECRHPETSFRKLLGRKNISFIRDAASHAYYGQKHIADALEEKIPPLFHELARKLKISLNTPRIE